MTPGDPGDDDDLDALLGDLRRRYAAELPERLAAIDAALAAGDPQARSLLHRLRGSAGTYGFAAVSEAAAHLGAALVAADPEAARRAQAALRAAVAAACA